MAAEVEAAVEALETGAEVVKGIGNMAEGAKQAVSAGASAIGALGKGVNAIRRANTFAKVAMPAAIVAGGLYGLGKGVRGTLQDMNNTLGNPVGYVATYGIHKTFSGNERLAYGNMVSGGIARTFSSSAANASLGNNLNATGNMVIGSGATNSGR